MPEILRRRPGDLKTQREVHYNLHSSVDAMEECDQIECRAETRRLARMKASVEDSKEFVIIAGNPVDGFGVIGTWNNMEVAIAWADNNFGRNIDWWLAPMQPWK
jgi:hypothetical protein